MAAGTTTDSTFAAPLAVPTPLSNEFIELLRPKTLLGRIPNLRTVPFNISVPSQTAGGTYAWVGQGKMKPLTSLATATVTLCINKIAGIIVLTEELVKISSPSAEALVRDEMIAGIVKFMDEQFIDPTVAASGTVSPASITNGTSAMTSAGTSNDNAKTDLKALMSAFVTANLSTANSVWIMSEANAFALAMAVNAMGAPLFPGMTAQGGTLFGIPSLPARALAPPSPWSTRRASSSLTTAASTST
jgi:HK97 family phage major capsid protein